MCCFTWVLRERHPRAHREKEDGSLSLSLWKCLETRLEKQNSNSQKAQKSCFWRRERGRWWWWRAHPYLRCFESVFVFWIGFAPLFSLLLLYYYRPPFFFFFFFFFFAWLLVFFPRRQPSLSPCLYHRVYQCFTQKSYSTKAREEKSLSKILSSFFLSLSRNARECECGLVGKAVP